MISTIKIEIPSLLENIRMIESFIDNVKEEYSLDDGIYGNIMIAVTESVNNAIRHGNKLDPNKNVKLCLQLDDSQVKFLIEDEGPGFNFNDLPDPTAPENIEKPGGRGIFLMKHLADEVSFKEEGKQVELIFYMN